MYGATSSARDDVAPRAGAWIETASITCKSLTADRRAPRGRVD